MPQPFPLTSQERAGSKYRKLHRLLKPANAMQGSLHVEKFFQVFAPPFFLSKLLDLQRNKSYTPGEKALMVNRFNIKIINVPYTNKHKSQIGEFGTQPPVAVA